MCLLQYIRIEKNNDFTLDYVVTELTMTKYFFIVHWFFIVSSIFSASKEVGPISKYLTSIEVTEFNTGLDLIDCIYVLNLDFRTEKWQSTKTACERYNLGINRVSAVNGWKLPKNIQQELASPYPIRLTPGSLGCLLTHLSILKDAYDREFSIIWVMEDDVEFLEDPKEVINLLPTLFRIDPEWVIFYTDIDYRNRNGYTRSLGLDPRPGQKLHSLKHYTTRDYCHKDIMRIRSRYGSHSLIISKNGIKKILDYFISRPIWTAIDIEIHYIPGIRQYSSRRNIVSNIIGAISDNAKSDFKIKE